MVSLNDEIYSLWKKEKPKYSILSEHIEAILLELNKELGIRAEINIRVKEDESLIKKVIKKDNPLEYFGNLSDKVGARVICNLKEDVDKIDARISSFFIVHNRENKTNLMEFYVQGYKSIHYDVSLKQNPIIDNIDKDIYKLKAEIQLRTLCEHIWATIYHDIGYKPSTEIPQEIKRKFHCLAGLLEVADDCFSSLVDEINDCPTINSDSLLPILIKSFNKILISDFNKDFSRENLPFLFPLIREKSKPEFEGNFNRFFDVNFKNIQKLILSHQEYRIEIPYINQPEILLILYLIENNVEGLTEKWEQYFDPTDLEKISVWWGNPVEFRT